MAESPKVFFTYVWGSPGEPAWPLTFRDRGSRTHAKRVLSEGDLVFTVCTKTEPSPVKDWGRVMAVYRVSDLEVNTADYGLPSRFGKVGFDSVALFPYALHPISVSEVVSSDNLFSELLGSLTNTHHLQARSRLVELSKTQGRILTNLRTRPLSLATPESAFGQGRVNLKNSKLAPKHEGAFSGEFRDPETWFVYVMRLVDETGKVVAVKIGYSGDPKDRASAYNMAMATEVTGLRWIAAFQQPCATEDQARTVEQAVLSQFQASRLGSNGEVLRIADAMKVESALGVIMRQMT
jgi:hypothetical protein